MNTTEWGSSNRHYSKDVNRNVRTEKDDLAYFEDYPDAKALQIHWEGLLKEIAPDAEERVTRTFKTWNLIVRDQLRNETGLRLSHGDQQVSVPVRIEPGIPEPLLIPLWDVRDIGFLLLHRNLISKAKQGVEFVVNNFSMVTGFLDDQGLISKLEPEFILDVNSVYDLLKKLDAELKKVDLLSRILRIDEDILGAYYFRIPQVRIYWLAIAIVALMLDVEIEALTLVVLIHELAHAYTHLGRDIDGRQWETKTFAETDIHIVEGLAQFYTNSVCKKLAARFPSALNTFNSLLEKQSQPYTCFQAWIDVRKNDPSEFIRQCMIQTRTIPYKKYDLFPGNIMPE